MDNQFDPNNKIIQLLLRGMGMEDSGKPEEASLLFSKAWSEATADFEKFIAAYYVARHQKNVSDKLKWFETSLQFALKVNDEAVKSAFPSLYLNIAKCYEALSDPDKAKKYVALSHSYKDTPSDPGPFFHGTRADLQVGELLTAKGESNYKSGLKMNHIYFTAVISGAGLAAALAKG
ncbi:MAG: NAD(+)--rifampin ADP-ribosyltransferase, partial [Trichococcus flocculiformis]